MLVFRLAILLGLLASAGLFIGYALTARPHFRRYGLLTLGWTLFAAFVFFAVLIADRML